MELFRSNVKLGYWLLSEMEHKGKYPVRGFTQTLIVRTLNCIDMFLTERTFQSRYHSIKYYEITKKISLLLCSRASK